MLLGVVIHPAVWSLSPQWRHQAEVSRRRRHILRWLEEGASTDPTISLLRPFLKSVSSSPAHVGAAATESRVAHDEEVAESPDQWQWRHGRGDGGGIEEWDEEEGGGSGPEIEVTRRRRQRMRRAQQEAFLDHEFMD